MVCIISLHLEGTWESFSIGYHALMLLIYVVILLFISSSYLFSLLKVSPKYWKLFISFIFFSWLHSLLSYLYQPLLLPCPRYSSSSTSLSLHYSIFQPFPVSSSMSHTLPRHLREPLSPRRFVQFPSYICP